MDSSPYREKVKNAVVYEWQSLKRNAAMRQ